MEREGVEVVEVVVPGMGPVDRLEALQPTGIRLVSGDEQAGVYRTTGAREAGAGVVREVYDWARLTIGGATRALWLFLLPFLLVNLVAWMQPFRLERRRATGAYRWLSQVLGLSLTVLAVTSFAQGAMDQLVWQCGTGGPAGGVCKDANPLVHLVRTHGTVPGMLLATLVPLLALGAMAYSARDGRSEYRSVRRTRPVGTDDPWQAVRAAERAEHPLSAPLFWEYNWRARGLACRHLCAGLLTLALLLTVPSYRAGTAAPAGLLLFAVITAAGGLVVLGTRWWPGSAGQWGFALGCLAVLVAAGGYYAASGGARTSQSMLPGVGVLTTAVLAGQALVLLALAAVCVTTPASDADRPALGGLAGPAMGVVACVSGWVYSTALVLWTQDWLTAEPERSRVAFPAAVRAIAAALPPTALLIGLVVAAAVALHTVGAWWSCLPRRTRRDGRPGRWRRLVREVEREEFEERRRELALTRARAAADPAPRSTRDRARRRLRRLLPPPVRRWAVHRAAARAALRSATAPTRPALLLRSLDHALGALAGTFVVVVAVFAGMAFHSADMLPRHYEDLLAAVLRLLTSLGSFMLVGLIVAMLVAVRTIVLRAESRRHTGMLWAFGAFWPRSAHPFTPATWTGRAIPELTHRLTSTLRPDGARVLLNAHSMGSMISVLALWQLSDAERPRIALLTTGCPLTSFFRRHYPAYVTEEAVAALTGPEVLAGWANVRRDTDVLAGRIGAERIDREPWPDGVGLTAASTAVRPGPRTSAQPVFVPLARHDFYRLDQRIEPVRAELVAALRGL
ncbi:hypothetical protein [Streptomyces antimicrobicus]|uniref:Integral membrane protein n=1 Tax=Streptomyces antimicrobicus TaxID=2883108 RepID=A0ABS8BAV6_9ACTN|nr:hypothetical protein [Streptomyces antimicrobicus]MCB5181750.1 hypothetical protein [Streptomyces antimicrobicus]